MRKKINTIILIVFGTLALLIFGGSYLISLFVGENPQQKKWDNYDAKFEKFVEILNRNDDSLSVSNALDSLAYYISNNDTIGLYDAQKTSYMQIDSLLKNRTEWERNLLVQRRIDKTFYIDGSSLYFVEAVKARLNDPDSFEHVKTTYYTNADMDWIALNMTFRAKNGFGGVITKVATCQLHDDKSIVNLQIRD